MRRGKIHLTYHVFNTENGALFASRSFEASLQDEQEADNEEFLRKPVEMYREKEVVDRYPEKKIIREYNRLLGVREEQERLAEQLA